MQDDSQNTTTTPGLAPEHRQCRYTKSDGARCRCWALHGRDHCFGHDRFLHARPERPIDIPLLEDGDSLLYVLSQTAQALAWGTLPVSNGHAILAICRLVQNTLNTRLDTAKLRLKARRLGIEEHELFPEQQANASAAPQTEDATPGGQPDPDG